HKLMLLEEGAKFNRIAAPPQEGQTIEARKFQIIEVARFFNVPPSKIMDYERATWGNMEEVNAQFLNDCLMEYIKPIEQIFTMQLLTEKERSEGYYIEYNLSSLLRGKMTERYTSYSQARQWGWLSVNEIREKENMSNIGTQGDIYLTPGNMLDSKEVEDAKTNAE
ncbi:MAG: phage portal protein, partial [Syntrophorhabdaceae bacterium]